MRVRTWAARIGLLAVLLAPARLAAEDGAAVTGTVRDAAGAPIAGAAVRLSRPATGFERATATSRSGGFTLAGCPPGDYELRVAATGHLPAAVGLRLTVGRTETVEVTLVRLEFEQTVTVSARPAPLETGESDVSVTIPEELVRDLPVVERNAIALALLAPGASPSTFIDPTKSRDGFDGVAFLGESGRENLVLVDGGDNNDDAVGSILQFYPQDSVQEFEVIAAGHKAEYGHTDGGVVNLVTRSGTNSLAGGAYGFFRGDALARRTFVEEEAGASEGELRQHVLGAYLGGPLCRDRAFFFANLDRTVRVRPLFTTTGGVIPEIDVQGHVPQDSRQTLALGKLTLSLGSRHLAVARWAFQDDRTLNANLSPSGAVDSDGTLTNRYHSLLVRDETLLGAGRRNRASWQWSRFRDHIGSNADGTRRERRGFIVEDGFFLGPVGGTPQATTQDKHQISDDLSWRASLGGDHDLKAGCEVQHVRLGGFFLSDLPKAYFFWYRAGDYLAGAPPDEALIVNGTVLDAAGHVNDIFSLYLQDDWKPFPRLTLNLGLRYDLETNDWGQRTRRFLSADPLFFGAQPGTDGDNVAPRLGFAYDLGSGDHLLRGSFGIFYQQVVFNWPLVVPRRDGRQSSELFLAGPEIAFDPYDPFCAPGGSGGGCVPVPSVPPADPAAFVGDGSLTAVDPRLKTPYAQHISLGFATVLPGRTVLEADYVRSRADHQIYRTRVGGRGSVRGLPTANLGIQARVVTQGGRLLYDGLLVSLHRRFGSVSGQVSYTFGRGRGVQSGLATLSDDRDQGLPRHEGPTLGQRDHQASAALAWTLPRGFTIGTVVKLASGYAFDGRDFELPDLDGDGFPGDGFADRAEGSPRGHGRQGEFRGDGFSQVDLRVGKSFTLAGRYRPQILLEVFNLFNARNEGPGGVNDDVRSPDFGRSAAVAGSPFEAQLAARLDF